MDDGERCLLDVINDPFALESFLNDTQSESLHSNILPSKAHQPRKDIELNNTKQYIDELPSFCGSPVNQYLNNSCLLNTSRQHGLANLQQYSVQIPSSHNLVSNIPTSIVSSCSSICRTSPYTVAAPAQANQSPNRTNSPYLGSGSSETSSGYSINSPSTPGFLAATRSPLSTFNSQVSPNQNSLSSASSQTSPKPPNPSPVRLSKSPILSMTNSHPTLLQALQGQISGGPTLTSSLPNAVLQILPSSQSGITTSGQKLQTSVSSRPIQPKPHLLPKPQGTGKTTNLRTSSPALSAAPSKGPTSILMNQSLLTNPNPSTLVLPPGAFTGQPLLIQQPNGMQFILKHPQQGQNSVLTAVPLSGQTANQTVVIPNQAIATSPAQGSAVLIQPTLTTGGAASGVLTAAPVRSQGHNSALLRLISPQQSPVQLQQLQTPGGPITIAVPSGQTLGLQTLRPYHPQGISHLGLTTLTLPQGHIPFENCCSSSGASINLSAKTDDTAKLNESMVIVHSNSDQFLDTNRPPPKKKPKRKKSRQEEPEHNTMDGLLDQAVKAAGIGEDDFLFDELPTGGDLSSTTSSQLITHLHSAQMLSTNPSVQLTLGNGGQMILQQDSTEINKSSTLSGIAHSSEKQYEIANHKTTSISTLPQNKTLSVSPKTLVINKQEDKNEIAKENGISCTTSPVLSNKITLNNSPSSKDSSVISIGRSNSQVVNTSSLANQLLIQSLQLNSMKNSSFKTAKTSIAPSEFLQCNGSVSTLLSSNNLPTAFVASSPMNSFHPLSSLASLPSSHSVLMQPVSNTSASCVSGSPVISVTLQHGNPVQFQQLNTVQTSQFTAVPNSTDAEGILRNTFLDNLVKSQAMSECKKSKKSLTPKRKKERKCDDIQEDNSKENIISNDRLVNSSNLPLTTSSVIANAVTLQQQQVSGRANFVQTSTMAPSGNSGVNEMYVCASGNMILTSALAQVPLTSGLSLTTQPFALTLSPQFQTIIGGVGTPACNTKESKIFNVLSAGSVDCNKSISSSQTVSHFSLASSEKTVNNSSSIYIQTSTSSPKCISQSSSSGAAKELLKKLQSTVFTNANSQHTNGSYILPPDKLKTMQLTLEKHEMCQGIDSELSKFKPTHSSQKQLLEELMETQDKLMKQKKATVVSIPNTQSLSVSPNCQFYSPPYNHLPKSCKSGPPIPANIQQNSHLVNILTDRNIPPVNNNPVRYYHQVGNQIISLTPQARQPLKASEIPATSTPTQLTNCSPLLIQVQSGILGTRHSRTSEVVCQKNDISAVCSKEDSSITPAKLSPQNLATLRFRIEQQLQQDQENAINPDCIKQFHNKWDACNKLIPYHVFHEPSLSEPELCAADAMFEASAAQLLQRHQYMLKKYQYLLFRESQKEASSAERVMIERMWVNEERYLLAKDREFVAQGKLLNLPSMPQHWKMNSLQHSTEDNCMNAVKQEENLNYNSSIPIPHSKIDCAKCELSEEVCNLKNGKLISPFDGSDSEDEELDAQTKHAISSILVQASDEEGCEYEELLVQPHPIYSGTLSDYDSDLDEAVRSILM